MKIILTNTSLNHFYGTETWTLAMAKELSKLHDVKVFTFRPGKMAEKVSEFAEVVTEMPQDGDFYIVNHNDCYPLVPKDKPMVYTSHGRFGVELFPDGDFPKVGVTEEVAHENPIIRNGIDCERFFSKRPLSKKLETVLYLSHPHYGQAKEIVREACQGLKLITIEEERFDIETLINEADLVITLGRGILESLACERNVISADWRAGWMETLSGGGMITEENFDSLKTHSFSGRNKPIIFTAERLKEEFQKYDSERSLRHKIIDEFDITKQCQKYLTYSKRDM